MYPVVIKSFLYRLWAYCSSIYAGSTEKGVEVTGRDGSMGLFQSIKLTCVFKIPSTQKKSCRDYELLKRRPRETNGRMRAIQIVRHSLTGSWSLLSKVARFSPLTLTCQDSSEYSLSTVFCMHTPGWPVISLLLWKGHLSRACKVLGRVKLLMAYLFQLPQL